ncbi:3-methyladenine DNA glycosylase [Arsenicicoccus sp. MKL-02]|uniref:3-methyladenine DNA glycosylase n=1 Tax=Arsenicicoccus cauae TaxID=2663847 RepID=A0A6I3IQD6_9MICO|nr:3-methyladenine DNA glycosylase [Arsenicicoccus cauae]MTB72170.1 3-methyladenine DNA glycosylase [Arsenicicoccus cauae]
MDVLTRAEWEPLAAAHRARAEAATSPHLARRARGEKHPVEDFLFEYYGFRPGHLARWHPGPGVALTDSPEHAAWSSYVTSAGLTSLDVPSYAEKRGATVRFVRDLLARTHGREARFGCFGLHEWAMVYRIPRDEVRHGSLPLRLGHAGTDAVVEAHDIRCSHFDAYRFFTPAAVGRNEIRPTRETVRDHEQPGCLHGGAMDLYRWAFKLAPGIPGDLVLDCFEIAREARLLDMMSSPYDTESLGLPNIAIETPQGKAEHVHRQRAISEAAAPVRERLIAACDALIAPT